jgi:hypothetical protein
MNRRFPCTNQRQFVNAIILMFLKGKQTMAFKRKHATETKIVTDGYSLQKASHFNTLDNIQHINITKNWTENLTDFNGQTVLQ